MTEAKNQNKNFIEQEKPAKDIGKTDDDQPNCHQGLRPKTTPSAPQSFHCF